MKWRDLNRKRRKGRRVAARGRGWEQKKTRGRIRVLEARWAWAGLGYSLATRNFIFLLQNNFGNLFLKTETTVSVKLFGQF